ncbi:hypothetical protein [Gluconobacter kondonii]|uniref:hypothetical protein n=1 Tax=Gluconobacter kondonii TaxID=941463 RepID=UPI00197F6257|nr:hypothetical protein [Gluconobacter kondonii]MBN3866498.1 hypothetical protein [Gluconobacter kondonii]MBS1076679.1 hypothetical protein [Gluconobacter kondonii]
MTPQKASRSAVWRSATALFVAGGFLAGCAAHPEMTGLPPSPNSRLYAYLIAHGMARGAVMTGQISPDGLTRLVTLDKAAQQATLNALKLQSSSANRQADQALSNLLADLPQKTPLRMTHPSEQTQKNRLP